MSTKNLKCAKIQWNTFEALFIIGGSKKDSAEKFLINYAKENGEFKKEELDGDIFYKRIDYSGSLMYVM